MNSSLAYKVTDKRKITLSDFMFDLRHICDYVL